MLQQSHPWAPIWTTSQKDTCQKNYKSKRYMLSSVRISTPHNSQDMEVT